MPFSEAFLEETRRAWQPLSQAPLTEGDCREIADSMIQLFTTLVKCAREREKREGGLNVPAPDDLG